MDEGGWWEKWIEISTCTLKYIEIHNILDNTYFSKDRLDHLKCFCRSFWVRTSVKEPDHKFVEKFS